MKKLISVLLGFVILYLLPNVVLANSVTLYPSIDTYVYTATPNQRYNNERDLLVFFDHPTNQVSYPLIKFSLDQIPAGSQVHRVTLTLYQRSGEGKSPLKLAFVSLGQDWNSNVTFSTKPSSGGYFTIDIDDDKAVGYKTWSLAGHVEKWVERTAPNYGLLLTESTGARDQSYKRIFASSEDPNPNLRPKLTVEYDLPNDQQAAAAAGQNNPINVANPLITIKPIITMVPIANFPAVDLTISDVKSENVTATTAKIIWKTNKNSTSWVAFGIATGGDLFNVLAGQNDSVKDHSVNLANLYPNRKYSYKVFSKDASGKQVFGPISYFTTAENAQVMVEVTPTPTVADSNLISNLQEKIENKVVESEINKAIENSNSNANETSGSESAIPNQTELKSTGALSGITDKVGIAKLAGILLILLGLMSIVGLMLLYFLGKKAHHHIRKHFKKKHK